MADHYKLYLSRINIAASIIKEHTPQEIELYLSTVEGLQASFPSLNKASAQSILNIIKAAKE